MVFNTSTLAYYYLQEYSGIQKLLGAWTQSGFLEQLCIKQISSLLGVGTPAGIICLYCVCLITPFSLRLLLTVKLMDLLCIFQKMTSTYKELSRVGLSCDH